MNRFNAALQQEMPHGSHAPPICWTSRAPARKIAASSTCEIVCLSSWPLHSCGAPHAQEARALLELRRVVEVVNVETIVLPNIHSPHEDGTADPSLHVSGDHGSRWYQVFRVWYKVPQELEPG